MPNRLPDHKKAPGTEVRPSSIQMRVRRDTYDVVEAIAKHERRPMTEQLDMLVVAGAKALNFDPQRLRHAARG